MKLNIINEYDFASGASLSPKRDAQISFNRHRATGPTRPTQDRRLEQLRQAAVVGNAHADRDLFDLAHEIATTARDRQDRYEALWHMDRAMGEPQLDLNDEQACEQALRDYLADVGEL